MIRLEADSLQAMAHALESDPERARAFHRAVDAVLGASAHLVVVGVGKSGHIAQKIAASFASTGTPAFFMHPTEASHGDLGMVAAGSVVIAISNSGESRELVDVLHYCRKTAVPVIALTQSPGSTLGRASTVVLEMPNSEEACPNGLAPTTSTTNALALGDALVVAVMAQKGVSRSEFGLRHPGGKLGRGLHTVADWLALNPHEPPVVGARAMIAEVVHAVSAGQAGCVAVVDDRGRFAGMITDGDLRRAMTPGVFERRAADIMTTEAITLEPGQIMADVIDTLTERRIATAFVLDNGAPIAVVNTKTLMSQGYI